MKKINKRTLLFLLIGFITITGCKAGMVNKNIDFSKSEKIENKFYTLGEQKESEEQFIADFRKKKYQIEDPKVIVDPYNSSPLTALLMFYTEKNVSVEIIVRGKDSKTDIQHKFPKGKEHIIPIFGLYPNYDNKVMIKLSDGTIKQVEIKCGDVPEYILPMTIINADKTEIGENKLYFLTSPQNIPPIAYDANGDLRWYLSKDYFGDMKRLKNGHLLVGSNIRFENNSSIGLVEMDMLGKVYRNHEIQGGFHDGFVELENGNIILSNNNVERPTVLDYIIEVNPTNGDIVREFDLYKVFSKVDSKFIKSLGDDWAYNNSIFYDKKSDDLVLSLHNRNSIVSIDYHTKEINWIISDPKNWNDSFSKYLFTTNNKDFRWPLGQSAAIVLPNGNIGYFNNGYDAVEGLELCRDVRDDYSNVIINKIDIKNKKIDQVWEYGKENNEYVYLLSDFEYLDKNNYLINIGGIGLNLDYSSDECTIPEADDLKTVLREIKNNKIIFEANISSGYYSFNKMSIYNNVGNYSLGEGKTIYSLKPSSNRKIPVDEVEKITNTTLTYPLSTNKEIDKISLNAIFFNEDAVDLILIPKKGETISYSYKKVGKEAVEYIYTGKIRDDYAIYLLINGRYYKTDKYISG